MITISLDWPLPDLSPNARVHWTSKSVASKLARAFGRAMTLKALDGKPHDLSGDLRITYTFHPPDRRKRDDDNITASLKSYRDGIFDALQMDDSHVAQTVVVRGEVVKGGAVEVKIEAIGIG